MRLRMADARQLSRLLRMLGFDTLYKNNYKNEAIITEALTQKRIVLTHDPGLLKNRSHNTRLSDKGNRSP